MNPPPTKWDFYPFGFVALIIVITIFAYFHHEILSQISDFSLVQIAFVVALAGIGFTFFCKKMEDRPKNNRREDKTFTKEPVSKLEHIEKIVSQEPKTKKSGGQLLIFAALFSTIAALAITQAVTVFSDPDKNPYINYAHSIKGFIELISSKPSFVIASFFAESILYIHCGIVFLLTDAKKIISSGNKFGFFISSLIIFLESVLIFYAANSIDNIINFVFWIFMLVLFDIAWIIINITKKIDILFQWIHLDGIVLFFLITMLIIFQSPSQIPIQVYEYILVIFLASTIADYALGWKTFWSEFDVSEVQV